MATNVAYRLPGNILLSLCGKVLCCRLKIKSVFAACNTHKPCHSLLLQTTSLHRLNSVLPLSAGTLGAGRTQAVLASVAQSGYSSELIKKNFACCCRS